MHSIDRIDPVRHMTITGSVTRDISKMPSDPIHDVAMDLTQKNSNPAFLRLADPIEEATIEIQASPFMRWLAVTPNWSRRFYENLQGLSQTSAGEKLLTTWISAERFWEMLRAASGNPTFDAIREQTASWRALGLDEIYFDFHVRGTDAAVAQAELGSAPVTA